MEKNQLHVSFDDGFHTSNEFPKDSGPKHTDNAERKKSILASTNNRMTDTKENDVEVETTKTASLPNPIEPNNNKNEMKSKLPISVGLGSPTVARKSSTLAPTIDVDIRSKIPVLKTEETPPTDSLINQPVVEKLDETRYETKPPVKLSGNNDNDIKPILNPSGNNDIDTKPTENPSGNIDIALALKGFQVNSKSYEAKIPRFNSNNEVITAVKKPSNEIKSIELDKESDSTSTDTANSANDTKQSDILNPEKDSKHDVAKPKTDPNKLKTIKSVSDTPEPKPKLGISGVNTDNTGNSPSITIKTESNEIKNEHKIKNLKSETTSTKNVIYNEKIPLTENNESSAVGNPQSKRRAHNSKEATSNVKDTNKMVSGSLIVKDSPKGNPSASKEMVKSKLLLQGSTQHAGKETTATSDASKTESRKTEKSVTVLTRAATPNPPATDSTDSTDKQSTSSKDQLSIPSTPSKGPGTEKKENKFPLLTSHSSSPNSVSSGTPRKENKQIEKSKSTARNTRESSPARSPSKTKTDTKITKSPPNSKQQSKSKKTNSADPITARDVKVLEKEKTTEDDEAKETADTILNELGEKPKSILARAALKKIAARATKSGQVPVQNGDIKHVIVNDSSLKDSKSSGKFALSVPATGKKDVVQGDEDRHSVDSRRDSTKYSIDSTSRKSIDIRMQNQVILANKQNLEDKPKSPLTNTDSWIRSAIPYLPLPVAILCLLMNILIPGTGTMLSGVCILCCGKPRVHSKDDYVIVTLCVNFWVGFAQLFTITFLLVGWFWSLAWGIRMIALAVEYRKEQQLQREKQLQTMALSAFGSASNMRSLFP